LHAIAVFRSTHHGVTVATTEPVADYLLEAMGATNLTPFRFQADVMNGVDPSPQDITLEGTLLSTHKVNVFVYNQQVVSSLTTQIRTAAQHAGVPVVGVYETMPTPGYTYQSWMLAEVRAISRAVTSKVSTEKL
jgi:zinc/manganese transport system substrate-binding protein